MATSLAVGLQHLAAQLARAQPSEAGTRGAVLLWAPGAELRGRGAPLGSWLRMRRALLVLHLAERAVGGEVPSLEDWLCCEYLAKATEDSLYKRPPSFQTIASHLRPLSRCWSGRHGGFWGGLSCLS